MVFIEDQITRNAYKEALSRLLISGLKISDPAVLDLLLHLSHNEADEALADGGFIALPPLMIPGTVHIIGPASDNKGLLKYYSCVEAVRCNSDNIKFAQRAKEFSDRRWKEHFFDANFEFVLSYILRRFGNHNGNKIKAVWVLLNRSPADFIGNQIGIALYDALRNADVFTVNPLKAREAGTKYVTRTVFCCANCASPLGDQGCLVCQNKEIDCEPDSGLGPLSPDIIEHLLNRGFVFGVDPHIALARELMRFKGNLPRRI